MKLDKVSSGLFFCSLQQPSHGSPLSTRHPLECEVPKLQDRMGSGFSQWLRWNGVQETALISSEGSKKDNFTTLGSEGPDRLLVPLCIALCMLIDIFEALLIESPCSSTMSSIKIAPFEATAISSIPSTVNLCATAFRSQRTKHISYRLTQLRKLYWAINDNADALVEACKQDLGKPTFETFVAEVDWCKNDIIFVTKNLKKWMKDESAPDIPLTNSLLNPKIRKEPLGNVLVIGAFNFPVQLSLGPFIGAIAAGCTGVLKPSEVSPATAMVLKKIVEESLDPSAYAVVNGGVPETSALLQEKWEKIFYTGGVGVGRIIAKKAAETLTPVCLELGGRNPAIVTKHADPRLAARRLLWGKLHNAGQVCISQNYIMVDREILPLFIEQLKIAMKEFYPNGTKSSPDFARIVNKRHYLRIKRMLDGTGGKILMGGEVDETQNYIDITVVQVEDENDSMIVDESFGPLIPLLAIDSVDDAIRIANSVHSTPLGLYPFGNKAETNRSKYATFMAMFIILTSIP